MTVNNSTQDPWWSCFCFCCNDVGSEKNKANKTEPTQKEKVEQRPVVLELPKRQPTQRKLSSGFTVELKPIDQQKTSTTICAPIIHSNVLKLEERTEETIERIRRQSIERERKSMETNSEQKQNTESSTK